MKKRLRNTTRKLELKRNTIRQVSTYCLAKIAGDPSGEPHCIVTRHSLC